MKLNKLKSLKIDSNGKLSGGFTSLNTSQMSKINGGKAPSDTNGYCTNTNGCGGQNDQCTNTTSC
ncbi:hypothetical protein [Flavobacterium piscis]|uniref:Bacteriocin n=1 Tax=Flavobacterium piscis TaxID=1114874 RepID=A0ABU1YCG4_9FLAO|nr:hypothetical protein [Flavobacterium piscis]MDR7211843.1 hypothetical protein [Flavobacterium piscis]